MQEALPGGCRLVDLNLRGDDRGGLVAIEAQLGAPFDIARVYYIFGTQSGVRRGLHAHRRLRQLAVAVNGACTMFLDDGKRQESVRLDRPDRGLILEPLTWHEMSDFTTGCVLLVLADAHYDEADYIRQYDEFREIARAADPL